MNTYIESLKSATQRMIDLRANKISALEMFYQGYRALGRHNDKRAVAEELEQLRLDQIVQKRGLGAIVGLSNVIKLLEDDVKYLSNCLEQESWDVVE